MGATAGSGSCCPPSGSDWRKQLFVVHPDTVVRWQRERFRRYWADRSKKLGRPGRPSIRREVRELIRTMAHINPLWRAPRIHGELRKLGIEVSERTVSRVLQTVKRPPSQAWKTFLQNHMGEIVAIVLQKGSHYVRTLYGESKARHLFRSLRSQSIWVSSCCAGACAAGTSAGRQSPEQSIPALPRLG